jgi:hypothetical protein
MSIYPAQTTTQGSIFNPDLWVAGETETIDTDYLNANYLKFSVAQGYETLNGMTNLGDTVFSNTPTCTTPTVIPSNDSSTKIPTTSWVQTVVGSGTVATLGTVMTNGNTASTDLNMNSNDITNLASITSDTSLTGQITFSLPPHSVDPILGEDLTTKSYVDGLVGQYSGGFNLYLNYSETLTVNSITYKKLSHTVSSAVQQSTTITTDGTNQLIASFISDAINITEIPTGLWSLYLYGGISATGGVVYYFFKIRKNSGGVLSDIATSGNSIDINATPSTNPDVYHMNATISSPVSVLITDRIIIEVYCIKISGTNVQLTTYFESSYYSYIQSTLNVKEEDIIVKNIECKDDCLYNIKFKIKDDIYRIYGNPTIQEEISILYKHYKNSKMSEDQIQHKFKEMTSNIQNEILDVMKDNDLNKLISIQKTHFSEE